MNSRDIERIDTLRLSDKDKAKLLLAIDEAPGSRSSRSTAGYVSPGWSKRSR